MKQQRTLKGITREMLKESASEKTVASYRYHTPRLLILVQSHNLVRGDIKLHKNSNRLVAVLHFDHVARSRQGMGKVKSWSRKVSNWNVVNLIEQR